MIISFMNSIFLPLFEYWYREFKKHNHKITIYCLDEKTYEELNYPLVIKKKYIIEKSHNAYNIWNKRNNVIFDLLKQGIDIIHTDLDCFWFGDPIDKLNKLDNDIIFSREFLMPEFKDPVCLGFYKIRSNDKTIKFFEKFLLNLKYDRIDQEIMNELLEKEHNLDIYLLPENIATRQTKLLTEDTILFHPRTTKDVATFSYFVRKKEKLINRNKYGTDQ